MPESKDEEQKRKLRELEGKNVAHYSVLLGAFIQTKMDRDKMLVTLSSAGIGLLIAVLTAVGVTYMWEGVLYAVALLAFGITIVSLIRVLDLNSKFIEEQLRGSDSGTKIKLRRLDRLSWICFAVALLSIVTLGSTSGIMHLIETGDTGMTDEQSLPDSNQEKPKEQKSLDGLERLKPETQVEPEPASNGGDAPKQKDGEGSGVQRSPD